jgi:hypothetical protein
MYAVTSANIASGALFSHIVSRKAKVHFVVYSLVEAGDLLRHGNGRLTWYSLGSRGITVARRQSR